VEELYDLETDPYEMRNLVYDPDYLEILGSLKQQLAEWRKAQGDTIPVNAYYNYQLSLISK
jgi:hypothetical protein